MSEKARCYRSRAAHLAMVTIYSDRINRARLGTGLAGDRVFP